MRSAKQFHGSNELTIGEVSRRTGVPASALRYYESEGLIHATRSESGQRRFTRATIRRVSFVRVAQQLGRSLSEIKDALDSLPDSRTPTEEDWARLSAAWRDSLNQQIGMLERLRDRLDGCIGCGCLSLNKCRMLNPSDQAARRGSGPRFILESAEAP